MAANLRWRPPVLSLPERLVDLPGGGGIGAEAFRARLRREAAQAPERFGLPEVFRLAVILSMEAHRLRVFPPRREEMEARLAEERKGAAAEPDALMARRDLLRFVRDGILLENLVRLRRKLAPGAAVGEARMRDELARLLQEYNPAIRSFADACPATIGDRDFTPREATGILLWIAPSGTLGEVLDAMIDERLLRAEALRQKLAPPEDASAGGLLQLLLASGLTDDSLRGQIEADAGRYAIVRARLLLLPDEPEGREGARKTANRILAEIRLGSLTFEEAARRYSVHASAEEGGDLGYLCASADLARQAPPQAYGLDFVRENGAVRSPLALAADPEIRARAFGMKEGEVSAPLLLDGGVALVQRVEVRAPRRIELLLPVLRRILFARRSAELLRTLRSAEGLIRYWRPAGRPVEPVADSG